MTDEELIEYILTSSTAGVYTIVEQFTEEERISHERFDTFSLRLCEEIEEYGKEAVIEKYLGGKKC